MAGNIQIIPSRRTGFGDFVDSLKPGLEQAFNIYTKKKLEEEQRKIALQEQERQRQQSITLAQQFAPDAFQPDYASALKSVPNLSTNFAPGFTPTQEQAQQIYQTQTGKTTVPSQFMKFNSEKAPEGFQYKIPGTGVPEFGYEKKQQLPTIAQQVMDIKTAQDLAKSMGVDEPLSVSGGKGGAIVKMGTGGGLLGNQKREDAKLIAQSMIDGTQPMDFSRLYGATAPVRAELAKRGIDVQKGMKDWLATSTYVKNLNSTQQVRLGQAIQSVKLSLDPLRELNKQFERTGVKVLNWMEVKAALNGIDPVKRDIATRYISQINLMKDEMAQAFMSGGVPTDRAFKLADDILNPFYGGQQLSKAIDQIQFNLGIREQAIGSMQPRIPGGFAESSNQPIQQAQGQGNLSQMSDDELRRIASGG